MCGLPHFPVAHYLYAAYWRRVNRSRVYGSIQTGFYYRSHGRKGNRKLQKHPRICGGKDASIPKRLEYPFASQIPRPNAHNALFPEKIVLCGVFLKRVQFVTGATILLAILAILIAIVVPNLAGLTGGARGNAAKTELSIVQTAMDTLMSEHEAVSVEARGASEAAAVGPYTSVTYWYVSNIDPMTGDESFSTDTANLRLRTTSTGTYYWGTTGEVTQSSYELQR